MTRKYAHSADEAKAFRQAVRAILICPLCGASEVRPQKASMTGLVVRCNGCKLKYHCERGVLAHAVRTKAADTSDFDRRRALNNLAAVLEPPGERDGYHHWRRGNRWQDETLVDG